MKLEEAKQRIETAIAQFGPRATPMIDLVMNEVRADLGAEAYNQLVQELDLELEYNIAPLDSGYSNF